MRPNRWKVCATAASLAMAGVSWWMCGGARKPGHERSAQLPPRDAKASLMLAAPPFPCATVPELAQPVPPAQDLVLTGLMDNGATPRALFEVIEPDRPTVRFALSDGESNDWLEIRSIDVANDAVVAVLKKPVVRARNAGVEIVLSSETHGMKNCLVAR